jgi:hypothetical protein
MLQRYLGQRSDIGLRKAVANTIFEPVNPFEAEARRQAKTSTLIAVAALAATSCCFAYFNFLP